MANLLSTIAPEFDILTQTNYLNRQVRDALQPEYVWRAIADDDMEVYPSKVGVPEIISVRGLRAPQVTPNNVTSPTDINAGMTPSAITYEQLSIQVDRYNDLDYTDLFARNFPIADKFVENIRTLAQGAASTADFLARNALYSVYTSQNTRVTANATLSATITVDDIRLFVANTGAQGQVATNTVVVGANTYVLQSATANAQLTSSFVAADGQLSGVAGTLTFTTNVANADAKVGQPVVAVNAPLVLRSNGRTTTSNLVVGDTLTMDLILQARNALVNNRVPSPKGGYVLYINPNALYGLYQDPMFQLLYRGEWNSSTYESAKVAKLLGVQIQEVTSCPVQALNGLTIHRPILVGQGALIEARMTDTMFREPPNPSATHVIVEDNIAFVTLPPIDAASQFVRQSYLMFVGYAARTDRGITPSVVPTATLANYKRAVVIECTQT